MNMMTTAGIFLAGIWLSLTLAGEAQTLSPLIIPPSNESGFAGMPEAKGRRMPDSREEMKESIRRVYLMGTFCTIQLYSPDSQSALRQIESLVLLMEKTEAELSTWKETSILSQLNRQPVGVPFEIDGSLHSLIRTLQYWSEATDSTFDPTVGKLLKAYGAKTGGKWPDQKAIEDAKADRGMRFYDLDVSGRWITRTRGVEIDCGAFGKGEALDRLPKDSAANCTWLVNLGGQILANGLPPGKDTWQVSVAHPQNRQESSLTIYLRSGSLATSGGSERDVEVNKRRLGHIINPNTGSPAEFNGSVSVWHEQALVADILSTALYVMGPEKGLPWAESRNLAACFLIPDEEGGATVLSSRAFRNLFL